MALCKAAHARASCSGITLILSLSNSWAKVTVMLALEARLLDFTDADGREGAYARKFTRRKADGAKSSTATPMQRLTLETGKAEAT